MAIRDFKKIKAEFKKWDSGSQPRFKNMRALIGESRSKVINADKVLKKQGPLWETGYQQLFASNKKWYVVADKLIKLQADHKAAVKAKDKSKSKELAKEIDKLETESDKLMDNFSKVYDRLKIINTEFIALTNAISDLP